MGAGPERHLNEYFWEPAPAVYRRSVRRPKVGLAPRGFKKHILYGQP